MKLPIILIGPMYSGKSTIATLLSKELGIPEVPLDYIAGYYYTKAGIDFEKLGEAMRSEDFKDYIDYVRPYELEAALAVVKDFPNAVISFGAGHSYYTNSKERDRFVSLREHATIILLLPSPDRETSKEVLDERMRKDREERESVKKLESRIRVNELFVDSKSNKRAANHVVYTKDKTTKEVAEEIIRLLD